MPIETLRQIRRLKAERHCPEERHLMAQIRSVRQQAQRTIRDVAAAAGVSHRHLNDLELGIGSPSLATLLRVTSELGYVVELRPVAGAAA